MGKPPPPPFRTMPERKRLFYNDVFPNLKGRLRKQKITLVWWNYDECMMPPPHCWQKSCLYDAEQDWKVWKREKGGGGRQYSSEAEERHGQSSSATLPVTSLSLEGKHNIILTIRILGALWAPIQYNIVLTWHDLLHLTLVPPFWKKKLNSSWF